MSALEWYSMMVRIIFQTTCFASIASFVVGCATNQFDSVVGAPKSYAVALLGTPDRVAKLKDGQEVWAYSASWFPKTAARGNSLTRNTLPRAPVAGQQDENQQSSQGGQSSVRARRTDGVVSLMAQDYVDEFDEVSDMLIEETLGPQDVYRYVYINRAGIVEGWLQY